MNRTKKMAQIVANIDKRFVTREVNTAGELDHRIHCFMEKLASTDDLPAVGVGIWPHGVGRKWLFVDDILPASGPRRVGAGLGHLEPLLAPRHMVARADGGQQVDDEGQDVEGEDEGNDWRPLGLPL